jgi:hypothetical protein
MLYSNGGLKINAPSIPVSTKAENIVIMDFIDYLEIKLNSLGE